MKRGKGIITAKDLDVQSRSGGRPWASRIAATDRLDAAAFIRRNHDRPHRAAARRLRSEGGRLAQRGRCICRPSMRRAFAVRNEVIADPDVVTFDRSGAARAGVQRRAAQDHLGRSRDAVE
jgi:hypothetical protein